MTRHTLLLSLLSLTALIACDPKPTATPVAQEPAAAKAPEAPAEKLKPMLWEVQGPNGPVYLLGTIHVGVDIDSHGYEVIRERFDKSTRFVMETDLSDAKEDMAKDMILPANQPNLEAQLGPEVWAKLDERFENAASAYKNMQPWVVTTMIIGKMISGLPAATPMDQELADRARSQGKEMAYLEPASLQLTLIKKHLNAEELKEMIVDFDKQKLELLELMEFYKKGDVAGMTEVSFRHKDRKPLMYEEMFYNRNRSWIPLIKEHIARGNVFIAFGAGHMVGQDGILDLLQKEGIEAKRIE
jgi:uncharacterized protein YbaP (TraB family)